jgi:choline dehydrogenase-like flavoprotein
MYLDAREIDSGTVLRADLCIVGAGAAGITIARELSGRGHDVLLLESGGFDSDDATTELNEGAIVGTPLDPVNPLPLEQTRLRFFGGTTNHWAGFCRPLDPVDFERRDHIPRSGWPFGREALEPYYERAAPVVGIGRNEFDWRWWDAEYGAGEAVLRDGDWRTEISQVSQRRVFGPRYREELGAARDIRVVLWANATDLVLADDASRLVRVECATLSGRRFQVEARAYVLAAGGIEVARILLASSTGIRPAGVGNEHDLVGRHFMEHFNVLAGAGALALRRDGWKLYEEGHLYPAGLDGEPDADVGLFGRLVPSAELQKREGLLSIEIAPLPTTVSFVETLAGDRWAGVASSDMQVLAGLTTGHRADVLFQTSALCEQAPNPASRVLLTRERDALGMPRVALDWRQTRLDRESIVRGLALAARELGSQGIGRMQVAMVSGGEPFVVHSADADAPGDLDFEFGSGFHHMGTARMHADPRHGVVDPNCRVHSVGNLYVAGSAVFPTSGSSPPTFTLTALALRLADHLRRKVLA